MTGVASLPGGGAVGLLLACLLAAAAVPSSSSGDSTSPWTWRCESGRCLRRSAEEVLDGLQPNTCKLTCCELSALWPRPTGPPRPDDGTVSFLIDNIEFSFATPEAVKPLLVTASEIFLENLRKLQPPTVLRILGNAETFLQHGPYGNHFLQLAMLILKNI